MGKLDNQVLVGNQNLTLYQSAENGIVVYLFEVKIPTRYIYMGQVQLADAPYHEAQNDDIDVERKVWIFLVTSIGNRKINEAILEEMEVIESEYE